jgi:hypothetical protein
MANNNKARVATVRIGHIEIEGLLLVDGSFAIGVSQVAELFSFDQSQATRTLKRLMGEDFSFRKTFSELNSKPVNILTLAQLEQLTIVLASSGNGKARDILGLPPIKPKKRKVEGYIYLIENTLSGNVKIGFSINPTERLMTLQCATDCELRLLTALPGTINKEKALHRKYKAYLIRNEWFSPSTEILLFFGLTERALGCQHVLSK